MSESILAGLDDGELFRRSFEDSTNTIVITDVRGRIVRANPAWLELHGYSLEQVLGKSTRIVRSEHSTREMYEHMWQQITDPSKGKWTGEIVNRRSDGEEIPLLLTITSIRHGDTIAGYMGIGLDIREQKRTEELKRLYELVVMHDLRSPLGSILSALEFLVGGHLGELAPRHRDLLERAHRQARRMLEMIATSIDVERLKRRQLQVDVAEVDLFEVLRTTRETFQEMARRRRVEVELRAGARVATAQDRLLWPLDALHVQRCVENLVKNAVEASPPGARVVCEVNDLSPGVSLKVSNEGDPIPADVRATLFHPFGTYGKRGGNGLGLYGVKLLVEAMGGSVRYETGARGTTFELCFPAGAQRREPRPLQASGSTSGAAG